MERLTEFWEGTYILSMKARGAGYDHYSVLSRLAAYEDTGLEPDEIPHWIPVSERLPEPEANVLIWQSYREDAPYANITIGHLHQESDLRRKPYWTWIAYGADMVHPKIEAWHRADFICPGDEFVTHWMPLPQPPKEEK
jgi:hypothetical protein